MSEEFALFDTRKALPDKKKKKNFSNKQNTLSRILNLDGFSLMEPSIFFSLLPYIPLLYRSMFQFPRSIANYDDMELDFSPVGIISDNCIRNFNNQKHDRITSLL